MLVRWSADRDGRRVEGNDIAVYRFRDGKIAQVWFYDDGYDEDAFSRREHGLETTTRTQPHSDFHGWQAVVVHSLRPDIPVLDSRGLHAAVRAVRHRGTATS